MALREFTDGTGMSWRVWDVTPAQVHPRSSDERLFSGYEQGWLAFESVDGEMRRRLCPCPVHWLHATAGELERLLAEAEPVPSRAPRRGTAGDLADVARVSVEVREVEHEPEVARKRPLRTFQFPGGRIWTVGLLTAHHEQGAQARQVLRFVSGAHTVDLERWPADWARYTDHQLADLLRAGAPPRSARANPTSSRRRIEDRRS